MSTRTSEAERLFADALRTPNAFAVKATPDYKAIARARKAERRWHRFAWAMCALMCAIVFCECLRVV